MKRSNRIGLLIVLVVIVVAITMIFTSISSKSDFDKKQMDAFFALISAQDMGFGSVSIFQDGKEIYRNQIGFADIETGRKINHNTRFRIGSISKTFTAVVIMQMIEEGNLSFENKLNEFFPEIKNSENITIGQMLSHQSGIFNITNDETWLEWRLLPITKEELVNKISEYEPAFEPGEREEYSNTNFTLLALIAEKVENESFENIIENRILKPIDLKDTQVSGNPVSQDNIAHSHYKITDWEKGIETDDSTLIGSGSMISTPYDLNVFFRNLFNGVFISDENLSAMIPMENVFGMGLMNIPFYEKFAFGHGGDIDGFHALSAHFPIEQVTFSFVTNGSVLPVNEIALTALSIYFDMDYDLSLFSRGNF